MEEQTTASQPTALLTPSTGQVWIQVIGRALYQAGYGLIQFYIPLIFVNQVGLSATAVGIGIGSGSLAGIFGHLLGGYLADSLAYGRKRTLRLSAGLSILAAIVLVLTQNLPLLVTANLLLGLSAGCYWTAADAAVIDVTPVEQRHTAFAIMVLADSLGGGLGILGGGILLAFLHQMQALFLFSSILFLIFLALVQSAVVETRQEHSAHTNIGQGFITALQDRSLQLFVLVNLLFTTYIALTNSTLPLYFTKIIGATPLANTPTAEATLVNVANLFTWCYVGVGAVIQIPIVQVLNSILRVRVLILSMLLWATGFILAWTTGLIDSLQLILMIATLSTLSIATAIYKPFATAIVAELAPSSLRAIYLAISYQCWSIGYFIGPILGGWAIDQSKATAQNLWLAATASTLCGVILLHFLDRHRASTLDLQSEDPAPTV